MIRETLLFALGCTLLPIVAQAATPRPVKAAPRNYEQAIRAVQNSMRDKQFQRAEQQLDGLNREFPNNQEVLAMLIRLQCTRHDFDKMRTTMRSAHYREPQAELQNAQQFCAQEQLYAQAQELLDKADATGALRIAEPWYRSGTDPYRAGLILARAYRLNHQDAEAAAVYAELARQFPNDPELATQSQRLQASVTLDQAQRSLDNGDAADAIRIAQPLFPTGPDPYRAGLILGRAYRLNHQDSEAAAIYAELARLFPNDPELATQSQRLQANITLDRAQRSLDNGDAADAIRIARPLFPTGPDPYRAGLILARAHRLNHQDAEAAAIYAELARLFPDDPELATQAVLMNLLTRNHAAGKAQFQQLPPNQQQAVLAGLGGAYELLFPHTLTLEGGWASSSGSYPNDNNAGVQLKTPLMAGTLVGRATHAQRFGQDAVAYGADYYRNLGNGYAAEIGAGHSPSNAFLARNSISFGLTKNLVACTIEGSIRHLMYSSSIADVYFAGFGMPLDGSWSFRNGIYYVPQTSTYTYLLVPQKQDAQGNRTYLYWTVGQSGEQLELNGTILRTPGYSIKLGRMVNLSAQLALSGDIFHEHLSGLYDRQGLNVAITQRW